MSTSNKDWTGNGNSIWKTLGASNHTDKERGDHDYYATSPDALELLAPHYPIHHKVFECACGGGHLAKWLTEHGHDVLATDLIDRGYGIGGVDFLKIGKAEMFNSNDDILNDWANGESFDILTNPPYKYATEFVLHALRLIPEEGHVLMFLKTTFLEGKERREKIYNINPPRYVYQFSSRVVCSKNGEDFSKMYTGAVLYCWQIYNKHNDEHITEIKWI